VSIYEWTANEPDTEACLSWKENVSCFRFEKSSPEMTSKEGVGEAIMHLFLISCLGFLLQAQTAGQPRGAPPGDLDKSAYFAFVDRDYIFTLEVVDAGVPILNFVSMAEQPAVLAAKQVRFRLENRTLVTRFFLVDTGNPKEPITTPTLNMKPRSSFGVRVQADLGEVRELSGVTLRVGEEDFRLAPLTSLAFENLALKVNRINLGSPDFRDDWNALKLDVIGSRVPAPRR
jgi:hypothetical protein